MGKRTTEAAAVLVEAEAFDHLGGWVIDQQFMDEMGSPFLLAHGLGDPVDDATTTVTVPAAGAYRVWVRTRDWVAPWDAPGAPGKFQVLVDGVALQTVFGTEGAAWHWQDGGMVTLPKTFSLALHDLTGFEGRCDALLFCADSDFRPPDGGQELAGLRDAMLNRGEPEDAGEFDVVVAGAGIAGICAALSAARLGLTVAFVQDRPVLAGNNSSEVRVWINGAVNQEPFPRIGDIVNELEQETRAHAGYENTAEIYEDEKKLGLVEAEESITLFLNHRANGVHMDGDSIRAVLAEDIRSGRRIRLGTRWVADCTGDGCVGFLAGADFDITLKGHMGPSNLWYPVETSGPVSFPRCPWAADLTDKPFPGRNMEGEYPRKPGLQSMGVWYWESGFDRDPIAEGEIIRDTNFRGMYGAWDCLKNVDKEYPNHKLAWAAFVAGKRESRRLLGDVILTQEDVLGNREFEDGCVVTGWHIDLHLADPAYQKGFEGEEFISEAHFTKTEAYWVPYRCLYSRNVPNLFMAGRNISVTHEALGTVRVMRTGGLMGEVVGMALAVCRKHDTDPRGIYEDHLEELEELMRRGVGRASCA
jgi:hypothetical protein